jgi:hypothetical protein
MDLLAIRTALASVVEQTVERCYPHPVRSMTYPCAVIEPQPGEFLDYLKAFKQGLVEVNLRITFLASLGDDEGTARISSWLSTGSGDSVPDILRVDKTLGGLVSDLVVRRAENAGWIEIPPGSQTWFASAEIAVDIYLPQ